jgi:hypothetical protein
MKTGRCQGRRPELHVAADNFRTHFTHEVCDWLAGNPDITFHRAPAGASSRSSVPGLSMPARYPLRFGNESAVDRLPGRAPALMPVRNDDS